MTATNRATRFSLALALTGVLCGTPVLHADIVTAAGPGAGPHVKGANSGNSAQKGKNDGQIEVESFSWGTTNAGNKPKTPDNVKSPNQKPTGLLVPAVQKYEAAADMEKEKEKAQKPGQGSAAPSYPGPGVETWLGKRFPPPAPTQPALKSGTGK